MKIHPAVIVVFAVLSADAAQWSPTTGGNLDDPSNWGSGYSTFAIRKAQSAPFTISSSPTNLPGKGSLRYDTNANTYTNDFGRGGVLNLQDCNLGFEAGAQVVQKSGKFISGGTSSLGITASVRETGYWLDGADSAVEMPNLSLTAVAEGTAPDIYPHFVVDNGAQATFTAVTAAGKGVIGVAGGSTLTANAISVQNGSVMTATQATVVVNTPSGSKLTPLEVLNGGQIEFVNSTFHYTGGTTFYFNGNAGSLISFKDSTVEFGTPRVGMKEDTDGLTIRFDNSTATQTGDQLFITGGGTSAESGDKTLVFAGANPHLSIQGSKGFHFRGGTVSLQFEIPAAGFPTDHPVLDLTHADAKFAKDSATVPTLSVKVSPKCPPGVYTLLRGKGATTIISDENMSCDSSRAKFVKTQVSGVDVLQLRISGGLILLLK